MRLTLRPNASSLYAARRARVAADPNAPPTVTGSVADRVFARDIAIAPVNVAAVFSGVGITYAPAPSSAALPAGLSLSSAGLITGTPTALVAGAVIVVRGTNANGFADVAFQVTVAQVPAQMAVPAVTAAGSSAVSVDRAAAPAANNSPITSYDLQFSIDNATWTLLAGITDPQTVSGLTASTTYFAQTRAVNAIGPGPWSASGSGATASASAGAVFLMIAGQSNSRTAGNSAAVPNAKYNAFLAAPNMWIGVSNGSGGHTFAPYVPGTGGNSDSYNSGGAWGSELEFVYQMRQAGDNRPVYVVKHGINGQDLYADWAPTAPGDDFSFLEAKVAAARAFFSANSITIGQEVLCWCQGEADSNYDFKANPYAANFVAFLAAIRSRVSASALFICERIRPLGYEPNGTGVVALEGFRNADKVREGQLAGVLGDGNATAVDTDFIRTNFDLIHPEEPWTEGKGLRCFAAWQGTYAGIYGSMFDTVPNAFAFTDTTGAAVSSVVTSSAVPILGFQRRTPISVTGGEYRILNSIIGDAVMQDWGSAPGFVENPFYKVQLRGTSSASNSTATNVTVTIGGVSDTWSITTEAAGVTFEAETNAFVATLAANGGGAMNATQKAALDALFVGLKADGLMTGSKLTRLYIGSMHDAVAGRIDLRDQITLMTFSAGSGGNVPWSTAGWNPGAVSQRGLNLRVNPSLTAQDGLGLFAWFGTMTASANADFTSLTDTNILMRVSSSLFRVKLNTATNQNLNGTYAEGFYSAYRSAAALTTYYGPAGTSLGTNTTASSAPVGTDLWLGHPSSITADRPVRAHGVLGAGCTATDIQNLRNRLNTFFGAFGA